MFTTSLRMRRNKSSYLQRDMDIHMIYHVSFQVVFWEHILCLEDMYNFPDLKDQPGYIMGYIMNVGDDLISVCMIIKPIRLSILVSSILILPTR